jgi:hypothetical protein
MTFAYSNLNDFHPDDTGYAAIADDFTAAIRARG